MLGATGNLTIRRYTPVTNPSKLSYAPTRFAAEIEGFTQRANLSRREVDIVVALIRNITSSEDIAQALRISTHTVNNHLKSIFEKTNTKSKTEILSNFLKFAAESTQKHALMIRKPRVLIVDDEPMICDHIERGLTARGARAYTLTDPSKALDAISRHNIDVVICDVRMPQASGCDVLKNVRNQYPGWPLFIFVTGFPDYSLEEILHLGGAAVLEKPVDLDLLYGAIVELTRDVEHRATHEEDVSTISESCHLGHEDIGFGGVFVDCATIPPGKFPIGGVVELPLALPDTSVPFKVKGRVRWKRDTQDDKLRAGVGLQILSANEDGVKALDQARLLSQTSSYIPMGIH